MISLESAPSVRTNSGALSNSLSDREIDVLMLIIEGYSNSKIAAMLYLSVNTVKSHVRNILIKLNVSDRTQAAVFALRHGIVHFPSP